MLGLCLVLGIGRAALAEESGDGVGDQPKPSLLERLSASVAKDGPPLLDATDRVMELPGVDDDKMKLVKDRLNEVALTKDRDNIRETRERFLAASKEPNWEQFAARFFGTSGPGNGTEPGNGPGTGSGTGTGTGTGSGSGSGNGTGAGSGGAAVDPPPPLVANGAPTVGTGPEPTSGNGTGGGTAGDVPGAVNPPSQMASGDGNGSAGATGSGAAAGGGSTGNGSVSSGNGSDGSGTSGSGGAPPSMAGSGNGAVSTGGGPASVPSASLPSGGGTGGASAVGAESAGFGFGGFGGGGGGGGTSGPSSAPLSSGNGNESGDGFLVSHRDQLPGSERPDAPGSTDDDGSGKTLVLALFSTGRDGAGDTGDRKGGDNGRDSTSGALDANGAASLRGDALLRLGGAPGSERDRALREAIAALTGGKPSKAGEDPALARVRRKMDSGELLWPDVNGRGTMPRGALGGPKKSTLKIDLGPGRAPRRWTKTMKDLLRSALGLLDVPEAGKKGKRSVLTTLATSVADGLLRPVARWLDRWDDAASAAPGSRYAAFMAPGLAAWGLAGSLLLALWARWRGWTIPLSAGSSWRWWLPPFLRRKKKSEEAKP